jgi:MYXO-CTERM domain-containing protein
VDVGADVPGEVAADVPPDLVFDADLIPPGKRSSGGCSTAPVAPGAGGGLAILLALAFLALRRPRPSVPPR